MSIERAPEPDYRETPSPRPDIRLLPPFEEDEDGSDINYRALKEGEQFANEMAKDKLVDIVIEVNGVPRQIRINASKRTLGNGQPISSYFDRFQDDIINRKRNKDLIIEDSEFDMSKRLTREALHSAQRAAGLDTTELPEDTSPARRRTDLPEADASIRKLAA